MDFDEIRKHVIVAMSMDDELMETLVLKGGNAIRIVYGIGARSSIDLDYSIPEDFIDLADVEARMTQGLRQRFGEVGYVVFDAHLKKRPMNPPDPRWGGYVLEFKLAPKDGFDPKNIDDMRFKQALVVAPGSQRKFRVDISKHEYCGAKQEVEVDGYGLFVYTPSMIVVEKLRSLCQQMPDYPMRVRKKPIEQPLFCKFTGAVIPVPC